MREFKEEETVKNVTCYCSFQRVTLVRKVLITLE